MFQKSIKFLALIPFLFFAFGCSNKANDDATASAVSAESGNNVAATVAFGVEQTAEANLILGTQSAIDAAETQQALSDMETQTALQEATASAEAEATAEELANNAAATQQVEDQLATINDILQVAGYSTSSGNLAWNQEQPDLRTVSGGRQYDLLNIGDGKEYSNFIIFVEVTWESSGFAGCGIILRSKDPIDNGQQYRFYTLRFSGRPAWDVELWQYNSWVTTVTGTVRYSSHIDLANEASNEYLLVAKDSLLTVYINGSRVSGVTLATRQEGLVGFFTWQQDGQTTCTFSNAWIWELP